MTKFIAAILVIAFTVLGFQAFRFLSAGAGSSSEKIVFAVPTGLTFHQIANQLEKKGLVTSALNMRILAKFTRQAGRVKMGEYSLDRGMTPQEILGVLTSGKSIQYAITFPEGANIYEMAALLEARGFYTKKDFLAACHDKELIHTLLGFEVSSLEGYLFPETYNLTRFTPLNDLIANMVLNFKTVFTELETQAKAQRNTFALSRHELVILASMVEKETGAPEERPLIASVFYNRLTKGMRLQSDPTIIYGIWDQIGVYEKNITKDDISNPTRYNTYTVARLPWGPIANPGRESLSAVMKPAKSDFLYFVSHNNGTHAFSKTYEDHMRAVKTYQLDPAAREGKSWRDLKKRTVQTEQTH